MSRVVLVDGLQTGLGLCAEGVMEAVEKEVLDAVASAKGKAERVLLVLDGLDFLLAATESRVEEMLDMVLELREVKNPTSMQLRRELTDTIINAANPCHRHLIIG